MKVLLEERVPPERVLMCHIQEYFFPGELATLILDPSSWRVNLDYPREILDAGMNVCIDCFGHRWDTEMLGVVLVQDYHRLAGLIALIEAGYGAQIVVGTDSFVKSHMRRFGGEGYARLTDFVAPTLETLGIDEVMRRRIFVDNPARLLQRL